MNWKHLIWLIPLCLVLGGMIAFYTAGWLLDFTAWELTARCTEKLQDSVLAWEEDLNMSNTTRLFYEGEYCYKSIDNIICPKRNITNMSVTP